MVEERSRSRRHSAARRVRRLGPSQASLALIDTPASCVMNQRIQPRAAVRTVSRCRSARLGLAIAAAAALCTAGQLGAQDDEQPATAAKPLVRARSPW